MKKHYVFQKIHYLTCMYVLGIVVNLQAQSIQPPVSQWQYTIERSEPTATGQPRLAKATNGDYGVLSGNTLTRLSLTGKPVWSKPVPGLYADSSRTRIAAQETIGLSATKDNGFVILVLDVTNRYYVTRLDSAGNETWTRLVARANAGPAVNIKETALAVTADGGLLLVGSYTDVLSYLTTTKLNAEGLVVSQWRVIYSGPAQLVTPVINQISTTPDNGYLLVGRVSGATTTDSHGLALQLNAQLNIIWQKTYASLSAIQRVVENPATKGSYIAVGSGPGNSGQAITLAPDKPDDGQLLASLPGVVSVVSLVNDRTGTITILDAAPTNNGDFRLTNGRLPTTDYWTKSYGGSGVDIPTDILSTDDGGYLVVGTTNSTNGDVVGKPTGTLATWVLKIGTAPQLTTLRILPPSYNCQTGFISFQTSGGDGSPITYTTPGIGRANTTDTFGTVDDELRNNTMTITIQATQSGQTVCYAVDLAAYCQTSSPATSTALTDTLKLTPPTYNCQTGAITFYSTGGDGTPVEYAATGITDWTRNPNQFVEPVLRTAANIEPLHLMARQSGKIVMYVFDLKAACGRARSAVDERTADIQLTLLGNPVRETALVEIAGAGGLAVGLRLIDARGQLLEQRTVEQAGQVEKQSFDLRQQAAGTFLLHTTVDGQIKTLKIVKQ
ncbi:T9SS type A sorting domain-containing protein [Spirosoma sp.]|uniref:T9SS type A sorting domain-containing protein n=1 Tax=Spirosoma sp. TaxID=1899569 RepID=UPI00260344F5|nr:T9SS type A sorting domain-containing protein [Spirosoma sp.]MCX6217157.1 T9SS type A sorting domain-containing protein [Spirosoma sp.]